MSEKFRARSLALLGGMLLLSGCVVSPIESSAQNPTLDWCPPLHNCASTEASTFVHSVDPFVLAKPLDEVWPQIRQAVEALPGTHIEQESQGYLFAKSYSEIFGFLDYFEVLAVPEENRLSVRSSSLIAITDLFVNARRVEQFRQHLIAQGIVDSEAQE